MKCPRCNGRKYIELDKIGLVTTSCPECNGTGVIDDELSIKTVSVNGETQTEHTIKAGEWFRGVINKDGDIIATNGDNSDTRSGDTSKPKQPSKRKKAKRARKKVS